MANREQEVVVSDFWGAKANDLITHPGTVNAYLALCLGGNYSDSELRKYLEWSQQHTRHTYVLIDDYEFRHNHMVLNGLDEHTATSSVLSEGANTAKKVAGIIFDLQYPYKEPPGQNIRPDTGLEDHRSHNLQIRRASKLLQDKDCSKVLQELQSRYNQDDYFRQAVHTQTQENLGSKFTRWAITRTKSEVETGLDQLSQFLLEEIAVSRCLIEWRDTVELSREPPMQIMQEIIYSSPDEYGHIQLKTTSSRSAP